MKSLQVFYSLFLSNSVTFLRLMSGELPWKLKLMIEIELREACYKDFLKTPNP